MHKTNNYINKFKKLSFRKKAGIITILALLIWYLFCLPSTLFDTPYSTLVSDQKGELLGARISEDGQWRFPPTDSLPSKYKTCVIQFEDRGFQYHPGVNPFSIARAFVQNIKARKIVSGGSTITMQTVRLMRNEKRTYFEKSIELIWATRLELTYSKNSILALYASHAPMGGNVVGIDAASWRYFGHDATSLSWAEAATLAVLPNAPSLMHFGKNRDALVSKRNRLLSRLHDKQIITETDYELALSEPLPNHPHALPQLAPHLVTQIYLQQPGQHVQTTIQKSLQMQTEDVLNRWNGEFSQNGIHNLAALVVDLQSNEVLAYSGNVQFDKNKAGSQVDIIQSFRSTGSILKPFLYCAMLQEGVMLPGELLPDVPINIGGFSPKNFSLQYDGAVHADEALARSLNVPSVVSLRRYGVPKFHQFLQKVGLSSLRKSSEHYGLSLILGGAEATLWEIANGFGLMARTVSSYNSDQTYPTTEDFTFTTVSRSEKSNSSASPVFNAGAAWLTLDALTNLNRPEELDWQSIPSMRKVAWKTGTSYGFRDAWAVGVTPRYLVAVWTGNASGEGRPGLTGARTSAQVMFDLFNLLPSTGWFDVPYNELTETPICRESGLLQGAYCPESSIDTLLIPHKGLQGNTCFYHKRIHLSQDGQYQVYQQCAGERGIMPVSWFVLPPSWAWYYKQQHPDYRSLPSFSPECLSGSRGQPMQFIYPYANAKLKLPKQLDGSPGKAIFELAHHQPSATVYWHLDNEYLGETSDVHQMELSPKRGEHRVTVVDEEGNALAIDFKVE